MFVIAGMVEAIGAVFGSLLAVALMCCLASGVANRLHHSNWAAFLVLGLLAIVSLSGLTHSGFVRLCAAYGLFGALFLWLTSRNKNLGSETLERDGK
ncbi:hypothetical protein [Novosphingobium sp. BL-52-GroH]|uniref:hypothetical protein n=1 Tax=Novosphingobium sp. BL-52-GroH TaxID=3349877 RepID=UPI00384BB8BC